MPASQASPTIVVVERMELRRACLISLLEPWAQSQGLRLVSLSPEQAPSKLDSGYPCSMLIVGLGGQSVLNRQHLHLLKVLHALGPDLPLVLVSDTAGVDEVAAALNLGAQGFVHTEMPPDLAIQAFAFILSGGSYFPPSAMRQLGQDCGSRAWLALDPARPAQLRGPGLH